MPSTKRWGGLRPAPYNPNARDSDGDGLVQEGTMWERPGGSKFVDRAGRLIAAAVSHTVDGAHIVSADGSPIDYKPARGGTPGVAGSGADLDLPDVPGKKQPLPSLSDMGARTIGEMQGTVGSPKPTAAERLREEVEAAIPPNPLMPHGEDGPRLSFLAEDMDWHSSGNFATVQGEGTLNGKKVNISTTRALAKDDLPDTVYHVTTAKDAVDGDGMLRVNPSAAGLGGNANDALSISVSTDKDIADQLALDMKSYFGWMRGDHTHDETREHLRRLAREDGWTYEPPGTDTDIHWLWADYLTRRSSNSPKHQRNPIFVGDQNPDIDPKQIKIYEIQRDAIPDDAVITDFDMGTKYGLEEARIWGDIPTSNIVDASEPSKLRESPIRESSVAAVPRTSEPPADVDAPGTLVPWQPEQGLTPSGRYLDSNLYDMPGYEDYEGTLPPVPEQETFTLPNGETLNIRGTDPHAAERDRLFNERRLNDFNERRRRKALGTERTWDHPARVDSETELGNILSIWRGGFAESASYRRIIGGEDPAPAYDTPETRGRADKLAEALEAATPLGIEQWRIQLASVEEGEIVDFPAASTALDRKQAEGYLDSVSIFDEVLSNRGGAPKKTLFRFPDDSPGVLHDDETDYPREAIVTGRYRVKSVTPGKVKNTDVDIAELEWVDQANIARLEEPDFTPIDGPEGQTIARRVIPDDLTDFESDVPMGDIVGEGSELWHVTTAVDAIRTEGFKEGGAGFGTGYDGGPKGVSVTYDKHAADSFEDQIKAAIYAANGGDDNNAILAPIFNATNDEVTARDLGEEMGLDTDRFVDEWDVDALVEVFDGDSFELYTQASQAAMDIQTERMDFAEPYDDFDEPGPRGLGWTIMPVVEDKEKLRGLDPDQVGTVKVASRGDATAADSLTRELRLNVDDVDIVDDGVHLDGEVPKLLPGRSGVDVVDATNRYVSDKIGFGSHVETAERSLKASNIGAPELGASFRTENSPTRLEANNRYSGSGWLNINGGLRGTEDITPENSGVIETLDSSIASSPTSEGHVVFRGLDASSLVGEDIEDGDVSEALGSLIGSTITDPAFMSTSLKPHDAIRFSSTKKKGDTAEPSTSPSVVMRIDVPEGTGAYYVRSRYDEKEVLLGRDTSLRVNGVTELRNAKGFETESVYVLETEVVSTVDEPTLAPELREPSYADYGRFADNQDYLNQYRDASEPERHDLAQASIAQQAAYGTARQDYRDAQKLEEARNTQVPLGEPRDTPERSSMTSTTGDLEVKGRTVKNGAKVEGLRGKETLDLSRSGIDRRVNSLATQIGEDFGVEVDEVVYALDWDEWWALDLTEDHAGALAFYDDGKVYISPRIARDLGSNDPDAYSYGARVLSHEIGHASSGAVKNNLVNSGLRPVTEEAGAEISSLYHFKRKFQQDLIEASQTGVPGVDGPLTYRGLKAEYLKAGYPERVEEMVLQSVRRNGWNREAALDDIMYTFTEGDSMDFVYDNDGKVVRIFPQNIDGRGATVDPIAEARWRSVWAQAPEDIMEPYRDVDPSAAYSADTPVIGEEHLTEAEWVERQVRVAALLYWLLEGEGL